MSVSEEVRIRAALSHAMGEAQSRGLSDLATRALIVAALPGIAWSGIEALVAQIAAKPAHESR